MRRGGWQNGNETLKTERKHRVMDLSFQGGGGTRQQRDSDCDSYWYGIETRQLSCCHGYRDEVDCVRH